MHSESLLEINGLKTWLRSGGKDVHAVDGIDLKIKKGETLCLVGESGSGKSITALSIIQLLPQRISQHPAGSILFDYRDLSDHHETLDMLKQPESKLCEIRGSRIAMIFQEPMTSLNPVFTVGEQISEALRLHHLDLTEEQAFEKAAIALEQVQIKNAKARLKDYPHQLSGGQRQRVMIAMAIACEPDLLIADEATTALDVTVQAEILKLMRELQERRGMSILFITHDFGVVAEMADRVAVMQAGKIVEQGSLDAVLHHPQHEYTRALLAALPHNLDKPFKVEKISSKTLIETKQLQVYFPVRAGFLRRTVDHIRAVDDVDMTIKKGEIVALVGESGCGKTTLGRAILRLTEPTGGKVYFSDDEITGLSRSAMKAYRREMQIVFQDPMSSLNPRLTVATMLTEPMAVHGIGKSQKERLALAHDLLEQVQLPGDYLWRYPHEFSGGQRQRIGIARALVLNPEFIVCDEVTSALDVSVQAEILKLLLKLRAERGLSLLFITHDIAVVEYISDRTLVMYQGKVVESGTTEQVCQSPKHAYTQKLISAVPSLSAY
ncbi:MAG TPA: ABC transporter ATP-binding protein [Chromatiales bacterium]|nr:ABC transporter ATP-binding protein [Thiotrichales bacterium]HIP68330.1 ABC transporter ATP-binding protein [Chromatiales bacterium]